MPTSEIGSSSFLTSIASEVTDYGGSRLAPVTASLGSSAGASSSSERRLGMPVDLYVTSPMMTGPEVVEVQTKPTALGYAPGPIDGIYGVATAGAVRAFQRDQGSRSTVSSVP